MFRRKTRDGRPSFAALAAVGLILIPFAWSSQQQEHQLDQGIVDATRQSRRPFVAGQGSSIDVEVKQEHHKNSKDTRIESRDQSALQTFAPARQNAGGIAVVAPSPAQAVGKQDTAGISSPLLQARSLQDWEVEDLILLATVDGSIYARNRKTGAPRWGPILTDAPVVETIYHRENSSLGLQHQHDDSLNDFLWIVEPVQDGEIYLYNKAQHGNLQKLQMTVKGLQESTPYASEHPPVVYAADKTTTLIHFDAATGQWLKSFGAGSQRSNAPTTCRLMGLGGYKEQECGLMGSLVLGRVTYTIHIEHRITGEPICTLTYSEWVPNARDGDLRLQYNASMDHKYVYSGHDGGLYAWNHDSRYNSKPVWKQKLPSPVVRVFDVAKPANSESRDTDLVVLTQPVGPINSEASLERRPDVNMVFVNQTSKGGWYALSEVMYPTVTRGARQAPCYDSQWLASPTQQNGISHTELGKVLVGVHPLAGIPDTDPLPQLQIGDQPNAGGDPAQSPYAETPLLPAAPAQDGFYISKVVVTIFGATSFLFAGLIAYCILFLDRTVIIDLLRKQFSSNAQVPRVQVAQSQSLLTIAAGPSKPDEQAQETAENSEAKHDGNVVLAKADRQEELHEAQAVPETTPESAQEALRKSIEANASITSANSTKTDPKSINIRIVESEKTQLIEEEVSQEVGGEKKKARRGKRGGKAHHRKKKGGKGEEDTDNADVGEVSPDSRLDLAVEKALEINKTPHVLEQDAVTVIPGGSDPTRVNDKTLKIGQLTVFEDKVLGFGSHGTRVFRGSFGGRDVAVKCMLKQLYDIASHEVTVLQESDDHPNVIRYYMMESAGDFMYIALELCPASLADAIDRPSEYLQLTGPNGLDLVEALRQITMGIRYLHYLKIVHRDIKPENILLAAPKRLPARPDLVQPSRLLISDFGLCKKLEVDQSSFRATTAHAAGTSGWRAPELLVDDESNELQRNETLGTQYSTSSEPVVVDTSTNRRVTRAIDIFALGCVFYYVLSKGNHPFDGKGRGEGKYMREANIIRGNHMLDDLSVLGAYQGEADDLISRMLARRPKDRPSATEVLAHPFFWSPADRLDFLCHVSDQFEFEPRDPPSFELQTLEDVAVDVIQDCRGDFLRKLPTDFVATLGKQRKYKGDHMLDLLRAMRNKKNHYEDMPDSVKSKVGSLPEGYLLFWTERFPKLLMKCHQVVQDCGWENKDRFRKYYQAE